MAIFELERQGTDLSILIRHKCRKEKVSIRNVLFKLCQIYRTGIIHVKYSDIGCDFFENFSYMKIIMSQVCQR